MEKYADIYEPNDNNTARFLLGKKGNKTLLVFGINPSTATDIEPDRTISIIRNFAAKNGYDGWIMCNVYPQRATYPSNLDSKLNTELHKRNLETIKQELKGDVGLLAAWGTNIYTREFLKDCLKDIINISKDYSWKCINITKYGHPGHPLFKKIDIFKDFNMGKYIETL